MCGTSPSWASSRWPTSSAALTITSRSSPPFGRKRFARLEDERDGAAVSGQPIDISYPGEGLREIFVNNVRREKPTRFLPDLLRTDPIAAFLGRKTFSHSFTGEHEDPFDYICRHTLRRPRDLMTIGQHLSESPEERRNEADSRRR